MRLTFLGSGSYFGGPDNYQSNILLETAAGNKLLIDCGMDIRFSLREAGYVLKDIDAVFVSNLRADRAGGLEYLGYWRHFSPPLPRPLLFGHESILTQLWEYKLKFNMECLTEQVATLETYFDTRYGYNQFEFDEVACSPIPTLATLNHDWGHMWSYGLFLDNGHNKVYLTGDIAFPDKEIEDDEGAIDHYWECLRDADVVFHDCVTSGWSDMHPNYRLLASFPDAIKNKMWLYQTAGREGNQVDKDGFLGVVQKGQVFEF
jgi:ribonuclease BN (tRNA processing enzyme)